MPNYNRNYEFPRKQFDDFEQKWEELNEIREMVVLLTKESTHSGIVEDLRKRLNTESKTACPSHLYLGLTPSKQQVVKDTWNEEIRSLQSSGVTEHNLLYLVNNMKTKENIEEVRLFLQNRKNNSLDSKEEKSFKRSFK